jgi:hypothetical protein
MMSRYKAMIAKKNYERSYIICMEIRKKPLANTILLPVQQT